MPGVWGLKYERILCCVVVLMGLLGCDQSQIQVDSQFTIQLPSTLNYELKHLRAYQSGDELIPEEVSELEFIFVLEPELPTTIEATLFEVAIDDETRVDPTTLQSESVQFITEWKALSGQTAEFAPPRVNQPDLNESSLEFELIPVMVDSAVRKPSAATEFGVEVTDPEFGRQLSLGKDGRSLLPEMSNFAPSIHSVKSWSPSF